MWCCDELGLAYERDDIGRDFGGNNEPDDLALNPNGRVPTLIDGSFVLWESNVIVRDLCAKHGPGTLYPIELERRADMEQRKAYKSLQGQADFRLRALSFVFAIRLQVMEMSYG